MQCNSNHQICIGIVDLTLGKIDVKKESFTDSLYKKYLGGIGYAIDFILHNMPPNADPLGSENYIGFCTGILSATNVPFSGRFTVIGKSPLTGTWGEANSGGRFGPELRKAGFDILLIKGKAKELSILNITDNSIKIEKSPELKGLDFIELENELKQKFGSKAQIAGIGLAGEQKVLITGIVTDKGRIAGRCGLGAIMGAKNLKAIVVEGKQPVSIHNPDGLRELQILINKRMKKGLNFLLKPGLKASTIFAPWLRRFKIKNFGSMSPSSMIIESYKRWGTSAGTAVCVEIGDAPVKNWNGSYKDFPLNRSIKITSDNVTKYQLRRYACKNCPIGCGGIMEYKDDHYDLPMTLKPEYETLAMLGSNLLNDDLGSIYAMNDYCNRQGLDTIAVGAILGMLMEAKEKEKVTDADLEGLSLTWGSTKDLLPLITKITNREGIGNILADGIGKAAKKLGIEEFAIHIKNQAIPAHDPRFSKSMVISYRLDPAPGRHTPFLESQIDLSKFNQMYPSLEKQNRINNFYCYKQVITSLGLCEFGLLMGNFPVLEAVNLVTGLDLVIEDLITIGERILTLKHLFNLREGINPLDHHLPLRILDRAMDGPNKNISLIKEEEEILKRFLTSLNWDDQTTKPNISRLKELGLEEIT